MNTARIKVLAVRPNDPSNVRVVTYLRNSLLHTLALRCALLHRPQAQPREYPRNFLKHYQESKLMQTPTRLETQAANKHDHEHARRALFEKIL